MGMFDRVQIDYDLGDEKLNKVTGWQTKDLDCELSKYIINKDGELILKQNLFAEMNDEYEVRRKYTGRMYLIGSIGDVEFPSICLTFEDGIVQSVETK